MQLTGAQLPHPSWAALAPMLPRRLLQFCVLAMGISVRPDPLWTPKGGLKSLCVRLSTHLSTAIKQGGYPPVTHCMQLWRSQQEGLSGIRADSKWNCARQTGQDLTEVSTDVLWLLAPFLMDGFCNLVSALPYCRGQDGPECGCVPCEEISKVWFSKPQYCKLHASLLLNLWPRWLTNDVGCVFECKTRLQWMEQISCWVSCVAHEHLSQHPATPERLWCLLFAKATCRNVLHLGLCSKHVSPFMTRS